MRGTNKETCLHVFAVGVPRGGFLWTPAARSPLIHVLDRVCRPPRASSAPSPDFTGHRYWQPAASPSPETTVIERVALAQIWPRLRPEHQVLAALTAYMTTTCWRQQRWASVAFY